MRHLLPRTLWSAAALLLGIALFGNGGAISAPDQPAAKQPKERKLVIHAPNGALDYDEATKTYTITDATIELPDSEAKLTASNIKFNNEERWAVATGNPRLQDPQCDITATTIRADLRAHRADITGNVQMVARPKPAQSAQGQNLRAKVKEPVHVACDTLQYQYQEKKGTAFGNLKITQKDSKGDRTATGSRLLYDGKLDTVALVENVQVTTTRGEGFKCSRVTFNMKDGAEGFKIEGLHDATIFVQDDEDPGAKKP